ncbi:MAG TPA: hypothetical protein VJ810_39065 [Blastocatellia bacterium]|nr:hypothetical protein [Blastocatellia bacterium]
MRSPTEFSFTAAVKKICLLLLLFSQWFAPPDDHRAGYRSGAKTCDSGENSVRFRYFAQRTCS